MDFEPIKKKGNKKRLFFILLTAVMFIGVSMAAIYFIYQYRDSRENKIVSGLISIDFTEGANVINLTNTVPVIDEVGLTNTPYTFTLKNTSTVPINANIKLEINSGTNIDLGAVRYAFYVEDRLITKDYLHDNLILYTYENLKRNEEINCKIVFWIDYYYDKPNKVFNAKIKAEGESIDIIMPSMQTMCPGCVYAYINDTYYATWNVYNETPSVLTSSDYKTNYQDVITESGMNYFLGMILDQNNQITRAFSCRLYNNTIPFCIEGTTDGSKYTSNSELLYKVYGEYDEVTRRGCKIYDNGGYRVGCIGSYGDDDAYTYVNGKVSTNEAGGECKVNSSGTLNCFDPVSSS